MMMDDTPAPRTTSCETEPFPFMTAVVATNLWRATVRVNDDESKTVIKAVRQAMRCHEVGRQVRVVYGSGSDERHRGIVWTAAVCEWAGDEDRMENKNRLRAMNDEDDLITDVTK